MLEDLAADAAATRDEPTADPGIVDTEAGPVDADGVVLTPEQVAAAVGGTVVSETAPVDTSAVVETKAQDRPAVVAPDWPEGRSKVCEWPAGCGTALPTEPNQDWVKLSGIRFRKYVCNAHFEEARNRGAKSPADFAGLS